MIHVFSEFVKYLVADVLFFSFINLLDKKGIEEMILPYMK